MSEVWSLPGYEVLGLVDGGRAGDLWRARLAATGEVVCLRRVARGPGPDRLGRQVALQADLPYAVRLREVVDDGQVLVLVLDDVPEVGLEGLVARRGALEPGEVVTLAVPLAEALAAAHAQGLGHGALTASSVLLRSDGMPLLAGLGLQPGDPDPSADVAALATLCLSLLGAAEDDESGAGAGGVPEGGGRLRAGAPDVEALLAVLESGRAADPRARPDAAALAALLRRAHPAAPVRLTPAAVVGAGIDRAGSRSRRRRSGAARSAPGWARSSSGARVALVLVLVVVAGAVVGWRSGSGGEQPAPAARAAAPGASGSTDTAPVAVPASSGEWAAVLDELDALRAAAFASADAAVLQEVYASGSEALVQDAALVQRLAAAGRTAHGVRHALRDLEVLAVSGAGARLRLVDVLSPYEVRDGSGAVVGRGAGRDEREQVVELDRTSAGWRIVSVATG